MYSRGFIANSENYSRGIKCAAERCISSLEHAYLLFLLQLLNYDIHLSLNSAQSSFSICNCSEKFASRCVCSMFV